MWKEPLRMYFTKCTWHNYKQICPGSTWNVRGGTTCISRPLVVCCSVLQCVAVCCSMLQYICIHEVCIFRKKHKNVHLSTHDLSLNLYAYICIPKIYVLREKHKNMHSTSHNCVQAAYRMRTALPHVFWAFLHMYIYVYICIYTQKEIWTSIFVYMQMCAGSISNARGGATCVSSALLRCARSGWPFARLGAFVIVSQCAYQHIETYICIHTNMQTIIHTHIRQHLQMSINKSFPIYKWVMVCLLLCVVTHLYVCLCVSWLVSMCVYHCVSWLIYLCVSRLIIMCVYVCRDSFLCVFIIVRHDSFIGGTWLVDTHSYVLCMLLLCVINESWRTMINTHRNESWHT